MKDLSNLTPMMKQYFEIKNKHPHCLLFFRLGDFYELFFDDAIIASKELDITLTSRDCGLKERAPMCGVPYHSVDPYISSLVERGYKIAICEQVEDPKKTKTIVKREVVRIISKGTIIDTTMLDETKNNYIMVIYENNKEFGISISDITTGEFITTEIASTDNKGIIDEIGRYNPSEILVNEKFSYEDGVYSIFNIKVNRYKDWAFEKLSAYKILTKHYKIHNLEGIGLEDKINAICASGALLEYLYETQKNSLVHITTLKYYYNNKYMNLDFSSRKNLELTETIRDGNKKGSLIWVLDKTNTAMGARLLRKWIESPLIIKNDIVLRLDAVEELKNKVLLREEIKEILNTIYDIPRIVSKIIYKTANARDIVSLKNSINNFPSIKTLLFNCDSNLLKDYHNSFDTLEDLYKIIDDCIKDEPPFSIREGDIINDNYNEELDTYREAKNLGTTWLFDLESKEREETRIKNLRIKYNKIFGYFIEVTNSYKNLVPDKYIRRQTLANSERYTIEELKKIEDKILHAAENINTLEYGIFMDLINNITKEVISIQKSTEIISYIDAIVSMAEVSDKNNYIKPILNDDDIIDIKDGRHPVIENINTNLFVPNDTILNNKNRLSIITGPNMSGKSTYMRQTALIVLMAQIGCFVPADYANISIVDRIFTRVGASDDLATGQSTFMIEMVEVANILNNATKKSLLILDEIGRGTSTYDGLSIAWAVLEFIADEKSIGAKTLFATHYHELTELEGIIDGVINYQVTVEKIGSEIIFLRKIERGGAKSSYGIHVAKLAGIPKYVTDRANTILQTLNNANVTKKSSAIEINNSKNDKEVKYTNKRNDTGIFLKESIMKIDLDNISPIEALKALYDLKEKTKNL